MVIVQRLGPVNYLIQKSRNSLPFVAHVDKLKRCYNRDTANWAVEGVKQFAAETDLPVRTDQSGQTEVDQTGDFGPDVPELPALNSPSVVADVSNKLERPRRDIRLPARYRVSMWLFLTFNVIMLNFNEMVFQHSMWQCWKFLLLFQHFMWQCWIFSMWWYLHSKGWYQSVSVIMLDYSIWWDSTVVINSCTYETLFEILQWLIGDIDPATMD